MKKVYKRISEGNQEIWISFVFFSLPDPSRMWHSEGGSEDIGFLCIKPIRQVANGGFVNQDIDWDVVPEGGVLGLWL